MNAPDYVYNCLFKYEHIYHWTITEATFLLYETTSFALRQSVNGFIFQGTNWLKRYASQLYSENALGKLLSRVFDDFPQLTQENAGIITQTWPRPLPSAYFPIQCHSTIRHSTVCTIRRESNPRNDEETGGGKYCTVGRNVIGAVQT